ncbi:MAG: hypothetical protein EHM50_03440 [Lysobacterales bacterium]|nr:MAG: hypothetical protein EHM50_03440 [Xanthomonadales bacterium]
MNGFTNKRGTRRSFFGHAGAALAAPLAATAAFAGELDGKRYIMGRRDTLDDVNAIRALQLTFARLVGAGSGEGIAALFAEPARASVEEHVRSLVADGDDAITIFTDGTASARLPCTVTTATPIESCGTLVEMARLQGDGLVVRSERRVLVSAFVKRHGVWKFESAKLEVQA